MEKAYITRDRQDLIYLIFCALHGQQPDQERIRSMDLDGIYRQARLHTLSALVAVALDRQLEPEQAGRWKEAREKALRKNILLDMESKAICAEMERQRIWHMPLKGSVMKNLYPRLEMREMADQDILFDADFREQMCRFMTERGYQSNRMERDHHDTYSKPPVYNIELHMALLSSDLNLKWIRYYENVRDRLIPNAPGSFGCHFSDEEFYIYMTIHAKKHYDVNGIGLRTLVDVYVFLSQKQAVLDWDYIDRQCAMLEIRDYERQCRALAQKLFGSEEIPELTDRELEMLAYFLDSGSFGTQENQIRNDLRNVLGDGEKLTGWVKFRYFLRRTFPSLRWMQGHFPILGKRPWLLPVMWGYRILRGIFKGGKRMLKELRQVLGAKEV